MLSSLLATQANDHHLLRPALLFAQVKWDASQFTCPNIRYVRTWDSPISKRTERNRQTHKKRT